MCTKDSCVGRCIYVQSQQERQNSFKFNKQSGQVLPYIKQLRYRYGVVGWVEAIEIIFIFPLFNLNPVQWREIANILPRNSLMSSYDSNMQKCLSPR